MRLLDVEWTPKVNMMKIRCTCMTVFRARVDRRIITCPGCSKRRDIDTVRGQRFWEGRMRMEFREGKTYHVKWRGQTGTVLRRTGLTYRRKDNDLDGGCLVFESPRGHRVVIYGNSIIAASPSIQTLKDSDA